MCGAWLVKREVLVRVLLRQLKLVAIARAVLVAWTWDLGERRVVLAHRAL